MKTVRLLPIVIFAAAALLVFKSIGLVTSGGYVLLGTTTVQAAGGGSSGGGEAAGDGTEVASDGAVSMFDPTMADTDPTAADSAPTLALGPEESEGAAAEGHSGAAPEAAVPDAEQPADAAAVACPPVEGEAAAGEAAPADGHAADPEAACDPANVTASGVAVPMMQDATGKLVPYSTGDGSQDAVVERLGERRTELESQAEELDMRQALVEAAEKRIEERTLVLQQLEARISSLVDQNKSVEEEQFRSLVSMYETMKPKEAAAIFDELDMGTLLRVARAMNPRKMAPIMAKMAATKAKDLTASMAVQPVEPTVAVTSEDLAALPQIVGQ